MFFGISDSSADSIVKPAASIAPRTAARLSGALVTWKTSPSRLDVVGAAVGRGEEELVLVDALGGDDHDAAPLELPGDRAGRRRACRRTW